MQPTMWHGPTSKQAIPHAVGPLAKTLFRLQCPLAPLSPQRGGHISVLLHTTDNMTRDIIHMCVCLPKYFSTPITLSAPPGAPFPPQAVVNLVMSKLTNVLSQGHICQGQGYLWPISTQLVSNIKCMPV